MYKKILIPFFIIFLPAFFFVKSSTLKAYTDYPELSLDVDYGFIIGETVLSFNSMYSVKINAKGYKKKIFNFEHNNGSNVFELKPAGTKILFNFIKEDLDGLEIFLNDVELDLNQDLELDQGEYNLSILSKKYLPYEKNFLIKGNEEEYFLDISFEDVKKKVFLKTNPSNINLTINGKSIGIGNKEIILDQANNIFVFSQGGEVLKETFYKVKDNVDEEINFDLNIFRKINLTSDIERTKVFVDGKYMGMTPVLFSYEKEVANILLKKPGYKDYKKQTKLNLGTNNISINLEKSFGDVNFTTNVEADLFIDGKLIGSTPQILKLQTIEKNYLLSNKGYRSISSKFIPDSSRSLEIDLNMLTERDAIILESPRIKKNSMGIELVLVNPKKIILGSPESEFRRDRNEIMRKIFITKHFYVSKNLITEAIFNNFKKISSGSNIMPINNISWVDAAKFCNWLSEKENHRPFYYFDKNKLINIDTNSTGYRLLAESEWELIAKGGGNNLKNYKIYPWGNAENITDLFGNFADESLRGEVSYILSGYDDGYKKRSPVGSFIENDLGLFDLGGNLSEWTHDFYSEDIFEEDSIWREDFLGPNFGLNHVIKGSNFKSATYKELGFSYRSKATSGSELVGFRIARWIY